MGAVAQQAAPAFDRLLAGDQALLARAISIIEAGGAAADGLAQRLCDHAGRADVLAVTGPPGAGKSTLIDAMIAKFRAQGTMVAVLAVDPSSPLSGGAILGDRTRMGQHSADRGVFIRSIAARGHLGGLALTVPAILDALDAAGWPIIILETVGAGQSETEVADFADVKIVVNAPGLGDDVQAIKAGILEIADILVVNKADQPLAKRTVNQLKDMLELRAENKRDVPIVSTAANKGEGLETLMDTVSQSLAAIASRSAEDKISRRLSGALLRRADSILKQRLRAIDDERLGSLCADIRNGNQTLDDAAKILLSQELRWRVE
ncbi:MAG: methylmalonyl Co-A mutase-associated GTPase MeaB [Pseudomonadota bacterium]